jgi:PAS domain S-box-containing protein
MTRPRKTRAETQHSGGTILIVDDQDEVRLAIQAILSLDDWDTDEAASGEDAVARVSRTPDFAGVVVDYRMPGLDGLEVARQIRGSGFGRPIVICSAYLNPELEREASALGAHTASKDDLGALREMIRQLRPSAPAKRKQLGLAAIIGSSEDAIISRAEGMFRGLLEAAPDAMVIADSAGVILLVNRQTEELFGYGREELLGKPVEMLVPEHVRDRHPSHRHGYLLDPSVRPMGAGVELRALRRDGGEVPVEILLSPLTIESETIVSAAIRDVTERKKTEEALQRARTIERETERLRELDRLKDEFLSTVSHELRTPLTVILGLAEVLRGRAGAEREDRVELLERIFTNASDMRKMVEQLLDYSRLEAGKVRLEIRPLPLRNAILRCVDLADGILGARRRCVDVPEGTKVQADEHGFERILVNLLTNAATYSAGHSTVRVTATAENGIATISVQDEGVGIPAAEQSQIFERFYRGSQRPRGRGTGVGLAVVRRYVELLGGGVSVESELGRGSAFAFTLPLSTGWEESAG